MPLQMRKTKRFDVASIGNLMSRIVMCNFSHGAAVFCKVSNASIRIILSWGHSNVLGAAKRIFPGGYGNILAALNAVIPGLQ